MMNEEYTNSSWKAFLIDLDYAYNQRRLGRSGAPHNAGTKVFMSVGALLNKKHTFMHDLESFFWVLFWICIHYTGPTDSRIVSTFEQWNYLKASDLAMLKLGTASNGLVFLATTKKFFTPYFQPLIPCMDRLRKVFFNKNETWRKEDEQVYSRMRRVLRKAMEDPRVLAKWPRD